MAYALTAPTGLLRSRDLFVHDGARLRRIRLSVPVQALFLALAVALVCWSAFAATRLLSAATPAPTGLEARARLLEQRQALIEAMLVGEKVDPALLAAAARTAAAQAGPLARLESNQVEQAALVAKALDVRYQVTAEELAKLGLTPAKVGGVGGPLDPASSADPTFKALFNSWKRLDTLQDGVFAVPSDKPVRTAAFTSSYGVRSDPFQGRAAMHAGIDLAGPVGTPIYATADGTVSTAGWNSGGYGNLIKIDHGRGIETRFGHLSAIMVREGQRVHRGDLIAKMGSTGRSTGSHLHYEVRIDGRAVNPIPFMKSTDYILALRGHQAGSSMDQVALGGPALRAAK
ncbi:M23 family metallopeptidase [Sphingomonas sp. BN140010]|uniref:M23 family metallopeptidase n=1 Tax=Sphingomonas arvum TaxID=2992113 RepID=A0ABT3JGH5_9SPHN|nr:M23 family metallopeptidase [Sphingomonas sp. BN140010]MCW3798183.1 M23 family metallopeptidase [Sphingomonas sp. BN140010]